MQREEHGKPEDKKVELEFVTTAGDVKDSFPPNEPLKTVKLQVMRRLGLDPSQADQFAVLRDGAELDDNKKLAELGLTDGTELFIERREVVKV
ncbi:hypothetical protein [Bradyrhizobium zhanjiangense]|uniref:Ubiquitin-like domain-containing protein n=1 Tax=Bradyrhizobium zhanjiangense TaxID=1325107 RepID=A0ABY0D9Z5_9BRAD|nr:hypothetical protein [Bradyrhizobium zhanjiangense]RXG87362.1 hypothetical protein EAS62_36085 [Bradyrhizobium zhanjiangense]